MLTSLLVNSLFPEVSNVIATLHGSRNRQAMRKDPIGRVKSTLEGVSNPPNCCINNLHRKQAELEVFSMNYGHKSSFK